MPFPVDEQYIEATERKLEVRFPESYRRAMMEENGGTVSTRPDAWALYPFFDSSDRKRLKRTAYDIVKETAAAQKWVAFPRGAIAIGSNGGGDQLIFLRDPEARNLSPTVYWWDHETGAVHAVAKDFSELEHESA